MHMGGCKGPENMAQRQQACSSQRRSYRWAARASSGAPWPVLRTVAPAVREEAKQTSVGWSAGPLPPSAVSACDVPCPTRSACPNTPCLAVRQQRLCALHCPPTPPCLAVADGLPPFPTLPWREHSQGQGLLLRTLTHMDELRPSPHGHSDNSRQDAYATRTLRAHPAEK